MKRFWPLLLRALPYIGAITLVVLMQMWSAHFGFRNFESDQAIFALMSKHISQGKPWPVYIYGERYSGTLYSILSAPIVYLWHSKTSVIAVRVLEIALTIPVLSLFILITRTAFSKRVTLLSILLAAAPGWIVLIFTAQPSANFSLRMLFTLSIVALSMFFPASAAGALVGAFVMGILFGLGMWTHSSFLLSIAIVALIWFLRSPEWTTILHTKKKWQSSLLRLLPLIASIALGITLFPEFARPTRATALWIGVIGFGILGIFVLWKSKRRSTLLLGLTAIVVGYLLGDSPRIISALFFGIKPDNRLFFYIPTFQELGPMFATQVPLIGGIYPPFLHVLQIKGFPMAKLILWGLFHIVLACSLVHYLWKYRAQLWKLCTFSPLKREDIAVVMHTLLFWLFFIAFWCLEPKYQEYGDARHIILSWLSLMLFVAVFFDSLFTRFKRFALCLFVVYFSFLAINTLTYSYKTWNTGLDISKESVAGMRAYFVEKKTTAAYGNFWNVYLFDYLWNEDVQVAPYSGKEAYRPYTDYAAKQKRFGLILSKARELRDPSVKDVPSLMTFLRKTEPSMPHFQVAADKIARSTLIERKTFETREIWILEDPQVP